MDHPSFSGLIGFHHSIAKNDVPPIYLKWNAWRWVLGKCFDSFWDICNFSCSVYEKTKYYNFNNININSLDFSTTDAANQ